MSGEWIYVTGYSANWSGTSLYINPELRAAKIIQSEFYGFYDDDGYPEYDETETFISIEKALEMVYPNEEKNNFHHKPYPRRLYWDSEKTERKRCLIWHCVNSA